MVIYGNLVGILRNTFLTSCLKLGPFINRLISEEDFEFCNLNNGCGL